MKVFKLIIIILAITILIISVLATFNPSSNEKNSTNNYIELNSKNYTNFLKDCHEDVNKYLGKKGHNYRIYL